MKGGSYELITMQWLIHYATIDTTRLLFEMHLKLELDEGRSCQKKLEISRLHFKVVQSSKSHLVKHFHSCA